MKTLLITINFNEEKLLPHFIKYYEQYCDKMIFYDGGSTDRSHEIINAHPKCELNLDYVSPEADDITFLEIKNELWKQYRYEYDWCIVVDIDEYLYYPSGLTELFTTLDNNLSTVVRPNGFDMYSELSVKETSNMLEEFNRGVPFVNSSKMCAFNIKKLESINYLAGCHKATPLEFDGIPALIFTTPDIKLLHFRYLGLQDVLKKKRMANNRLSARNKQNGYGIHNLQPEQDWINRFNENLKNSIRVI